jgi:hypothetical protein
MGTLKIEGKNLYKIHVARQPKLAELCPYNGFEKAIRSMKFNCSFYQTIT